MSEGVDQLGKPQSDAISLGEEAQALEVLAQSIKGLREVVNNLTRLRPTKRLEFRVTIFGCARVLRDHCVYGLSEGSPGRIVSR